MSGDLGLGSPWARAGVPQAARDEIRALIPDGCMVTVIGHAHGGGHTFCIRGFIDGEKVTEQSNVRDAVAVCTETARTLARLVAA
jgi:hypothetical protein